MALQTHRLPETRSVGSLFKQGPGNMILPWSFRQTSNKLWDFSSSATKRMKSVSLLESLSCSLRAFFTLLKLYSLPAYVLSLHPELRLSSLRGDYMFSLCRQGSLTPLQGHISQRPIFPWVIVSVMDRWPVQGAPCLDQVQLMQSRCGTVNGLHS